MTSAVELLQLSREELLAILIERSCQVAVPLTNNDASNHDALLTDIEGIVYKLNDRKSVKDSVEIRWLASNAGNMQIIVTVGTKKTGPPANEFQWPHGSPLIIPREGEYADFFGQEPRLVRKVTYTFELLRDTDPALVRLTIHIQTV